MTPSQAYGAMMSLRAARDRCAALMQRCDEEQRAYIAQHRKHLPLEQCPSYRHMRAAHGTVRRLRLQYGV